MRKKSDRHKARPVSTTSIGSRHDSIRSRGSVKRRDARPPSITEVVIAENSAVPHWVRAHNYV